MVGRLRPVSHDEEALLLEVLELPLVSESFRVNYLPEFILLAESDVGDLLVLGEGSPLCGHELQGLDSVDAPLVPDLEASLAAEHVVGREAFGWLDLSVVLVLEVLLCLLVGEACRFKTQFLTLEGLLLLGGNRGDLGLFLLLLGESLAAEAIALPVRERLRLALWLDW